jgi:predicted porin
MQKKIIALAIAAAMTAPAMAFADASVYGIVDVAAAGISGNGTKSDMQILSGGLSTSRLGVNASEDVGNGMKASINLEYKIDAGTSSSITTARSQFVGLSGNFGTVDLGYLQTTGYYWAARFNPVEGSTVSPLNNVVKAGGFLTSAASGYNRLSHAVGYMSPDFNGVTVGANYSTGADNTDNIGVASGATTGLKNTVGMLSVNYATGPIAAGFVYTKSSNDDTPTVAASNMTEYALGGSYDFGVAKLLATYQSNTPSGMSANKAMSISATAPVGPGTVVVSYAKSKMATVTPLGIPNASGSGETLAYLYDMSKTVTVYGAYTAMAQDAGTNAYSVAGNILSGGALSNGGSSSMLAVGIRKKF